MGPSRTDSPNPDDLSDASRWASAWGRPLDAEAAAAWRSLRDRFEQAVDRGAIGDLSVGVDSEGSQALQALLIADRMGLAALDRAGDDGGDRDG